ncbi:hypothetical protein JA1_004161 [Spathaspora sp. JA1]|nr:hypothetical protein JA1_004161 [Spathaspora sp. JA1]
MSSRGVSSSETDPSSNFTELEVEVLLEYKTLLNQLISLNEDIKGIIEKGEKKDNKNIHGLLEDWQQLEKKSGIVNKVFESALYDLIRNYDGAEVGQAEQLE